MDPNGQLEGTTKQENYSNREVLNLALKDKLKKDYSLEYQKKLRWIVKEMNAFNKERRHLSQAGS